MKISESPYGMTETYTVKYWYVNHEGYLRQAEDDFYSRSKSAHAQVEAFAKKSLSKLLSKVEIISVIYN